MKGLTGEQTTYFIEKSFRVHSSGKISLEGFNASEAPVSLKQPLVAIGAVTNDLAIWLTAVLMVMISLLIMKLVVA